MNERDNNKIAIDLARQSLKKGDELIITVDSISMTPCAREGDKYTFVAADLDLVIGDIVFVDKEGRAITHRVIAVSGNRFLVKGDIRPDNDGYFGGSEVVAICKKITRGNEIRLLREKREKRLGKITAFLSRWHGRWFLLTGSSRKPLSRAVFAPFHYIHWLLLNLIYRRHRV